MQSVLRSIKPYWLYLILIGKKTVEVGKDFPKSASWNREVYLYCSKDRKSFNRIPKEDKNGCGNVSVKSPVDLCAVK